MSSHLNEQRKAGKASSSAQAYLNGEGAGGGFRREIQWQGEDVLTTEEGRELVKFFPFSSDKSLLSVPQCQAL